MGKNRTISKAYEQIAGNSWAEILDAQTFYAHPTPLRVHLPMQPYHSRDLVHLDAALNVCRRRVLKGRAARVLARPHKELTALLPK